MSFFLKKRLFCGIISLMRGLAEGSFMTVRQSVKIYYSEG